MTFYDHVAVPDPGFLRRGRQLKGWCTNQLFWPFWPQKLLEIEKNWSHVRSKPPHPPTNCNSFYFNNFIKILRFKLTMLNNANMRNLSLQINIWTFFKLYPHQTSSGASSISISNKVPLECIVVLQNWTHNHFQVSGWVSSCTHESNVFNGNKLTLPLDARCGYTLKATLHFTNVQTKITRGVLVLLIFGQFSPECKKKWELSLQKFSKTTTPQAFAKMRFLHDSNIGHFYKKLKQNKRLISKHIT